MTATVSPRIPSAGPILLLVPGVSDVAILANTIGPEVRFRMPGPYLLAGFWLGEQNTATPAAVANLRLRMQDDQANELVIDGAGLLDNLGGLGVMGRRPRWQPFRRVIRAGDKWLFQIENQNAFAVVPQFYLRLEAE